MRKILYYIYIIVGTIAIGAIVVIDIISCIDAPARVPAFDFKRDMSEFLFLVLIVIIVEFGKELIKKAIKWFKK